MLQNWVGNGIGIGFSPLTLSKSKNANLVIFWKQDGNSSSILEDKMTENEREFFPKPWKVKLNKRRQAKLDKLENEGGRIIDLKANKKTKYIVEKESYQICNFQKPL